MSDQPVTVQTTIESKLQAAFQPLFKEITNESHMHNVPPGSESHFKVVLVSESFAAKRPVQRHQQVYGVLSEEMAGSIHALALHTFTPEEWQQQSNTPDSPNCMGSGK